MKAMEQYFPEVLFVVLLSYDTTYYAAQGGFNFRVRGRNPKMNAIE